jgi:chromosome partitioning protein
MGKVISLSNHKGGVGKTCSTVNIGAGLSKQGKHVLLIDLDPQANLSLSLGIKEAEFHIYGALIGKYNLRKTICQVSERLDVVPSHLDLSGAEIELSSESGREFILRELISEVKDKYDYILIDCPPSLGLLTLNALTASDEVYIPLQAEFLAMQGLAKLTEVIEKIKRRLNKGLEIGGVFITQFDSRKVLNKDVAASIETYFKDKVFKTRIRDTVSLAESPSSGTDIFKYSAKSNGAEDYLALTNEILVKDKHSIPSLPNNKSKQKKPSKHSKQ